MNERLQGIFASAKVYVELEGQAPTRSMLQRWIIDRTSFKPDQVNKAVDEILSELECPVTGAVCAEIKPICQDEANFCYLKS